MAAVDFDPVIVLRRLLPDGVAIAATTADPGLESLHPAERALVAGAVDKRRREFAQGRVCAARVLSELGLPRTPLLRAEDRAPLWPAGVVGSISHCAGLCAVAAGPAARFAGIGVDVERAEALERELFDRVLTERESIRVGELPAREAGCIAKLLFSVKEAAYKAAYPTLRRFVGFRECEVELSRGDGFVATLAPPWLDRALEVPGRHATAGGFVVSVAVLGPGSDAGRL